MHLLMRSIFLISFLFLFFSCKMVEVNQPETHANETIEFKKEYFNSLETDYLFKGQIEIYGNQISTLLVVKKTDNSTFRAAITNDFGNKLLDIEITNDQYKIMYVAKDLNKKIILNPLISDLLFLIKKSYFCQKIEGKETLYSAIIKNGNLLTIDASKFNKQSFVFLTSKNKIIKEFTNEFIDTHLNSIAIIHHDLNLKIDYTRILNTN